MSHRRKVLKLNTDSDKLETCDKKKHKVISDTESDSDLISGSDTYSDESDSESVYFNETTTDEESVEITEISLKSIGTQTDESCLKKKKKIIVKKRA